MKTIITQILYISIFLVNLVIAGYEHGKPKTGTNNAYKSIISMFIGEAFLIQA